MGKTEERLRDAAMALGSTLEPTDIPPLRMPETTDLAQHRRLRLPESTAAGSRGFRSAGRLPATRRWLFPLSAVASVAAILAVLILVRSLLGGPEHGTAKPAGPARLKVVTERRAGRSWTVWELTGAGSSDLQITAMTAISPTSAWAFASDNSGTNRRPVAWRLTGSAWTAISFPGLRGEQIVAAQASSPDNVWAFTSDNRAIRWNGTSWTVVRGFPARSVGSAVVISRSDVWVFSQLYQPGDYRLTTWHYNGHAWSPVPAAYGLGEASATSADDIWAVFESVTARWNGAAWTRYSALAVLPRRSMYCGPIVTDVYAVSAADAWAIGYENCQDIGGLSVLLHYAGGSWHRVARLGEFDVAAILPDGRGGLLMPADVVQRPGSTLLHYFDGRVTAAPLPLRSDQLKMWIGAAAPHGVGVFVAGVDSVAGQGATGIVLRRDA